jgi:uncharacterized membrane protein YfcA
MFPTMLLGALLGVLVNIILPEAVLLIGLSIILISLSFKSFFTAIKLKRKEDADRVVKVLAENIESSEVEVKKYEKVTEEINDKSPNKTQVKDSSNANILPPINDIRQIEESEKNSEHHSEEQNDNAEEKKEGESSEEEDINPVETERDIIQEKETPDEIKASDEVHPTIQKIIKREQTHCKPVTLIMVPALFFVLIFLSLLRGNSNFDSIVGVKSCSPLSFVLLIMIILFYIGMTTVNIILIKKEYRIKVKHGYTFAEGDLQWTPKLLVQFIISAFAAGFVAGGVGLGGGVIFNPLLLSFDVPPLVASASGMFMIMCGSLSNSFLYVMAGYLNIGFAFWCGAFVAVGTAIGIKSINGIIKKTGKTSYLAFLLVLVIAISAIVVPIFGGIQMVQDSNDGEDIWKFGSF